MRTKPLILKTKKTKKTKTREPFPIVMGKEAYKEHEKAITEALQNFNFRSAKGKWNGHFSVILYSVEELDTLLEFLGRKDKRRK